MLGEVLMLVLGFALPVINDEGAKDFDDSFGDFDSGTVGNELVHSSPFADDIFECVYKLFLGMHSVNINDKGFTTNEDLGHLHPISADSSGGSKNGVRGNGFIACLLYTSPSPRDQRGSRMPSSA